MYEIALKHRAHVNRPRRIQSSACDPLLKFGDVERRIRLVRAVRFDLISETVHLRKRRNTHKFLNPRFGNSLVIGV